MIVNPIAGMGGRVGLKGTDGESAYQAALARGGCPEASSRMVQALEALRQLNPEAAIVTCRGAMGEAAVRQAGFLPERVLPIGGGRTCSQDTAQAVAVMDGLGIDLLLFAGGDGTARDVAAAHQGMAPVIGIPAGVKMQSAVFSRTPRDGGKLAADWLSGRISGTREAEVMDLDEAQYRSGIISSSFYGVLSVPEDRSALQGKKCRSASGDREAQLDIAAEVIRRMQDRLYLIGPGTTTRAIFSHLGQEGTLIGVDALKDRRVIARDLSETEILDLVAHEEAGLVLTPIGGQGFLLGRGNQQISPRVLEQIRVENILVMATPGKLHSLKGQPLRVDTGEPEMDRRLSGYIRIITGIKEEMVYPISL